jgi:hypothetical protein
MKRKKTKYSVVSLMLLFVFSIVLSSCETSRVAPDVGRPNPPAPPAVALVLSGSVVDNISGAAVAGATVTIQGTSLSTTTNGSGVFTFSDLSNINSTSIVLLVSGVNLNYGYGSGYATIYKTTNQASFPTIYLTKIVAGTPVTVTAAAGGTATTSSTEASGSTTVKITVPPTVVNQSTQVSIAFVPSNATPQSGSYTTTNDVSSVHVYPDNAVFASPGASITFSLPFQIDAGKVLPVYTIVNGAYQSANINATVDASGLTATANVFSGGSYTLIANIGISISNSSVKGTSKTLYKTNSDLSFSLSGGSTTINLPTTLTNGTITSGNQNVNQTWISNEVKKNLTLYDVVQLENSGTATIYLPEVLNFPGFAGHPNYVVNGVEQNPSNLNQAGTWYYEWFYMPITSTSSVTLSNTSYLPNFTINFTATYNSYTPDNGPNATGWWWVAHNQGGIGNYYGL